MFFICSRSELCLAPVIMSRAARERSRLVEKGRLARPQPAREGKRGREFFYSNRPQPIEKARFGKIDASK